MSNAGARWTRRANVVVRVQGDETLVLDESSKKAHCLSGTTARVWAECERPQTIEQIALALEVDIDAVESSLAELDDLGLLAGAGVSRRALLTRGAAVGGALVAAGVVSIPLPAAARANSAVFSITNISQDCGVLNILLGTGDLSFTLNTTGAGHALTPNATYKVTYSYTTRPRTIAGWNLLASTSTATDDGTTNSTYRFTTNGSGQINSGAGVVFTTSQPYYGSLTSIKVTNIADSTDTQTLSLSAPGRCAF